MSSFPFITSNILQSNLDLAQDHIVDLTALSESSQYKTKEVLVSSLRKTIIILTASIVEALLLWKLKEKCRNDKIELSDEWKYFDIKLLYELNSSEQVVGATRRIEKKDIDKLDFVRITDLCVKYKILGSKKLRSDIDKVRELRNRLHIGGLSELEKEYKKLDLEFCFNVANRVKDRVQK